MSATIIGPVIALTAWSMVMWTVMYIYRIPAIQRMKIKMDPTNPDLLKVLPPEVRWKADNYNHLMEQPTVFYAICFALAFLGVGNGLNTQLAWSYVVLRVVHSFVQITSNHIPTRFGVFTISTFFLIALVARGALVVYSLP